MRRCADSHCSALIDQGRYCALHKKRDKPYYRDPTTQAFYLSATWKRLRKMKLAKDPLCETCHLSGRVTAATMVHHTVPLRDFIEQGLDMIYLISLCMSCHGQVEAELKGMEGYQEG
ncbi:MAG: HNH endonuclease [Thermodesulfobacteriota bacterium]